MVTTRPGSKIIVDFDIENTGGTAGDGQDITLTTEDGTKVTVDTLEDFTVNPGNVESGALEWQTGLDNPAERYQLCVETTDGEDCTEAIVWRPTFDSYYPINEGSGYTLFDNVADRDIVIFQSDPITWETGIGIDDTYVAIPRPTNVDRSLLDSINTFGTWVNLPTSGSQFVAQFGGIIDLQANNPNDGDIRYRVTDTGGNAQVTNGFTVGVNEWVFTSYIIDSVNSEVTLYAGLPQDNSLSVIDTLPIDDQAITNTTLTFDVDFGNTTLGIDGLFLDTDPALEEIELFFDYSKEDHIA